MNFRVHNIMKFGRVQFSAWYYSKIGYDQQQSHNTRPKLFVLLKYPTQKVYDGSISADSVPTCGGKELMKIATSNAIGFRYRRAEVSWLVSSLCQWRFYKKGWIFLTFELTEYIWNMSCESYNFQYFILIIKFV